MMSNPPEQPPSQPVQPLCFGCLTKRELLAALAMQGLLAADAQYDRNEAIANMAVMQADALMAALEQ